MSGSTPRRSPRWTVPSSCPSGSTRFGTASPPRSPASTSPGSTRTCAIRARNSRSAGRRAGRGTVEQPLQAGLEGRVAREIDGYRPGAEQFGDDRRLLHVKRLELQGRMAREARHPAASLDDGTPLGVERQRAVEVPAIDGGEAGG